MAGRYYELRTALFAHYLQLREDWLRYRNNSHRAIGFRSVNVDFIRSVLFQHTARLIDSQDSRMEVYIIPSERKQLTEPSTRHDLNLTLEYGLWDS